MLWGIYFDWWWRLNMVTRYDGTPTGSLRRGWSRTGAVIFNADQIVIEDGNC